jgi:hypothetical protein
MADLADPAQMFDVNNMGAFLQQNIVWFALIGILAFIIYYFVSFSSKKPKIISRADVEKKKRIDSLAINSNEITETIENQDGTKSNSAVKYKDLFHGMRWLGSIKNIGRRIEIDDKQRPILKTLEEKLEKIKDDPNSTLKEKKDAETQIEEFIEKHGENVFEIVYNPPLILNFANTLKKELIRIYKKSLIFDKSKGNIVIKPEISIDRHLGYYYDVANEPTHLNWFNQNLFKNDKEDLSSFYFVESQKKSTLDLKNAADMAMKEKELQLELARKRGKMSSI